MTERRLWFRAKRYGWGWTPATWEGWVATALYCLAFGLWLVYLVKTPGSGGISLLGVVPLLLLTAGFIALCWGRGEKPRWRWGGKSTP